MSSSLFRLVRKCLESISGAIVPKPVYDPLSVKNGGTLGLEQISRGFCIFLILNDILLIAEHVRCTHVYINQSLSKKSIATFTIRKS